MNQLYPEIKPYAIQELAVGQGHVLMIEECGNPKGIPIVFLHGGPGSHCKPYHRSFFNPQLYRIILFDQRGAGRSTPTGSLQDNTTQHLLADLEVIRKQLEITHWVIFGSSWGTTLGLLYAQHYPEKVLGLVLRSTFLARERDILWCYRDGGVNRLFPKQWQAFTRFLPTGHWETPLAIYHEYLTGQNQKKAQIAALAWSAWTGCVVSLGLFESPTEISENLLLEAKIECHYLFNHCFIQENQILNQLETITDVPAILIHGQRDLMSPLENSYILEQNWPAARIKIVPTAGHLSKEPDMLAAIVEATDEMATMLKSFWLDK